MSGLEAIALTPLLVAAFFLIGAVPLWAAAKVVNAGRTEFARVLLIQVVSIAALFALVGILGLKGLLLLPLLVWLVLSKVLETSLLKAFVLMLLWLAFQVALNKLFGS